MWLTEEDVRSAGRFVIVACDMEWVGRSSRSMTDHHAVDMACCNVHTGNAIRVPIAPNVTDQVLQTSDLAKVSREDLKKDNAVPMVDALQLIDAWLRTQATEGQTCILVAHNAFRADCIVLRQECTRAGFWLNTPHYFMDSLMFARHAMRGKVDAFDMLSLCQHFEIEVDDSKVHTAAYDAVLLVRVLTRMNNITPFCGLALSPSDVSVTVVKGIGAHPAKTLAECNVHGLYDLACRMPGLSPRACTEFFKGEAVFEWMDEQQLFDISTSVAAAVEQYL